MPKMLPEELQEMHPGGGEQTQFVTVRTSGISLAYETFGDSNNPAVLLMEGVGADMTVFPVSELIEPLVAKGCYVIRMDHRDNGQSQYYTGEAVSIVWTLVKQKLKDGLGRLGPNNTVPYTLEDMALDAVELLDALSIEQAHLWGHSMGGMIAQLMAIRYPSRVLSLTIIGSCPGPGAGPYSGSLWQMSTINNEECTQWQPHAAKFDEIVKAKTAYYKAQSGVMWTEEWHVRQNQERVWRMTKGYAEYLLGSDRHTCAVISAQSRQEALTNLRKNGMEAPVLVIAGSLDPIIPSANGELIASLVEGAQLKIIQGMGHLIVPEACPQLLDAFLSHCLGQAI